MKWLRILLMAATAASSGCVLHHPGSQTLVFNPFDKDGWVRPANGEGNEFWREATGDRHWGEGERHWLTR
ncbi:MAG: hypothetical protein ACYSWU_23015 [Planctomycetota bacterium]|jgi:hypothetical protein